MKTAPTLRKPPGDQSPETFRVPERLARPIIEHLLSNTSDRTCPRILRIHGLPGNGKSLGVRGTLATCGVAITTADPVMFESLEAGEPPRILKNLYLQAATARRSNRASALVIDDAHVFLGRYEGIQYTVNTQHLQGLLLALCDDPSKVFGRQTVKVPIYFTCNRTDGLPEELCRPGRMSNLHWFLTLNDRCSAIVRLFPKLDRDEAEHLVLTFAEEPLSFFADLGRLWVQSQQRVELKDVKDALRLALAGKWQASSPEPEVDELLLLAHKVVISRRQSQLKEE